MLTLAIGLICLVPMASFAITPYSQDFEALIQADPFALGDDGWVVYGNIYNPLGEWIRGYGTYPAPNNGLAFCQITIGEGGPEQGDQQLVIFSDYENTDDHTNLNLVESNTFQEQPIGAADVGKKWTFTFDAKMGNLELNSTALAFIKTIDPLNNWNTTNFFQVDMTATPVEWTGYSLSIVIDAGLEGQLIQFGFQNVATNFEGSGIYYDNVNWDGADFSSVPNGSSVLGATLRQNYPNPFNPMTRIDFALDSSEVVDISVFDLGGRRVATLLRGKLGAGEHHVTWNGTTNSGASAPAGQYWYLLKTGHGQVSRNMVLLK